MIEIKLGIIAVCAALYWWGGFSFLASRRFIMPTILTGSTLYFTHDIWALTMLLSIIFFSMGYGEKSIFHHIFGDAWARFVWMCLVSTSLSLGLFLTGHLAVYFFIPYIVIAGTLGITLRQINQLIGDPIFGAWLAAILLIAK